MKHKHADLIHAWADGAQIQWNDPNYDEPWSDIQVPSWCENFEYRIKPEPKPDTVLMGWVLADGRSSSFQGWRSFSGVWPDNLRLIFDGETGKLKSAEVL